MFITRNKNIGINVFRMMLTDGKYGAILLKEYDVNGIRNANAVNSFPSPAVHKPKSNIRNPSNAAITMFEREWMMYNLSNGTPITKKRKTCMRIA